MAWQVTGVPLWSTPWYSSSKLWTNSPRGWTEWMRERIFYNYIYHSLFSPISRSGPIYLPGTIIRHNVRLFYSSKGKKCTLPWCLTDASLVEEFSVESLSSSSISTNEHSDPNSAINTKKLSSLFQLTFSGTTPVKISPLIAKKLYNRLFYGFWGLRAFFQNNTVKWL